MGQFDLLGANLNYMAILEFFLRLVVAAVCGGIVGIERSRRFKDAGVRTHSMVSCAAALMMIVSKYGFMDMLSAEGMRASDPARIAAQVVTGVSFLGAGIIYRDKQQGSIKGLTTAAGIWCVAGIGLAVGAGLYLIAVLATILILIMQFVMHRIQVGNDRYDSARMKVIIKDDPDCVERLNKQLSKWGVLLADSAVVRDNGNLCYDLEIKIPSRDLQKEINSMMADDPDIVSIRLRDII